MSLIMAVFAQKTITSATTDFKTEKLHFSPQGFEHVACQALHSFQIKFQLSMQSCIIFIFV